MPSRLAALRLTLSGPHWLLIGMAALLALAAAYTSLLIQERQNALSRANRYDLAWAASQSALEVSRLGQSLGLHHLAQTPRSAREVRTRYEILLSRTQLFDGAEFQAFSDADAGSAGLLNAIQADVAALEPLVQNLGAGDNLQRAMLGVAAVTPSVVSLAAAANNFGGARATEQHQTLLHLHWAFSSVTVVLLLSGAAFLVSIARQNRTLKAIRGELAEQIERFDAAIGNMPHGLAMFDREGRLIVGNRKLPAVLGLPAEALRHGFTLPALGADRRAAGRPSEAAILEELAFALAGGRTGAFLHHLEDGRSISVSRAEAAGGGAVCILEDVTTRVRAQSERENLEAQLRQAQKMEAVGQLTGGIAHDFNNLLTVVLGNAEILAESRSEEVRGLAATIVDAAERGADLTHKLLAFGRRQSLLLEPLNLNEAVQGMMPLLRRAVGEHIDLATEVADPRAAALADRSLLESAVLNLVVNARDAMPQGGRLTIGLGARPALPGEGALTPGQAVAYVSVADTGHGMPPEVVAKAFEPFFTTKEVGRGSGLGLSMVYGFAQQSGGHVAIRSAPGQGTAITIVLPTDAPAARAEPAPPRFAAAA